MTSSLPFGVGEAFVIPEIEELVKRGHEITVVPTWPRGEVVHADASVVVERTLRAPVFSGAVVATAAQELVRSPLRALRALALLARSRNAKILVKNLAVFPKGLWLAAQLRRDRVEHVHVHWAAVSATMALVAAEMARVPWSITTHRWDLKENNLIGVKARRACFVRAINRGGADELRAIVGERFDPRVLHVGVRLAERLAPRAPAGRLRVLMPALLLPVKGHEYLLDAVRALADRGLEITVDLAGDGPLRGTIEGRVASLDLHDRVRVLGIVPHEQLLGRIEAGEWDAVVLASVVTPDGEKEGIPVSLMEAMARGVPAVGTATGGMPELLDRGAGLLVPERDSTALADALERLAVDGALREACAAAGRARIEEEFAVERVVDELEQLIAGCRGR